MKKLTRSLLVVAAFALLAGQLSAEVINVNFSRWGTPGANTMTNAPGQAVLDDSGTAGVWSNLGRTDVGTDLSDSDGNATTVDIDMGPIGSWNGANSPLVVPTDYVWTGATNTFAFTGLSAGQEYEVAFLGHGNDLTSTIWTMGGVSKTNAPVDLSKTVWVEGENYNTFTFTADGSGEATGTWQAGSGTAGAVGGLQIAAIPEPATLGLVATLGGALLFLRRRFVVA